MILDIAQDKKHGLHDALVEAGFSGVAFAADGITVADPGDDIDAVQEFVDGYDPTALAREEAVRRTKEEAGRRIEATFPRWRQRNMLARAVELQSLLAEGPFSDSQQAELDALRDAWIWVVAVRDASNLIEADVQDMPAADAIAFDASLADAWPDAWVSV